MSLDPIRLHPTVIMSVSIYHGPPWHHRHLVMHVRLPPYPWTGTAYNNLADRDWSTVMIWILNQHIFQSCVLKSCPLADKSFHCITFRVTKHSQIRHAWLFNAAICPWIMITWINVGTLGLMTSTKFVSSVKNFLGI